MPYVTGGFAYGQVTSSAGLSYAPTSGSATSFSASRRLDRTGWTAGAGVEYAVTDNLHFGVEHLYTDLGTSTLLQGSFGTGMVADRLTDGDGTIAGRIGLKTTANVVRVTLNYKFGAAPPPPPPPAFVAKDFVVYFPFDQSILTPEAQSMVQQAAQYANEGQATRIVVVGHTDTSGGVAYNLRLSERRAKATADALVALACRRPL